MKKTVTCVIPVLLCILLMVSCTEEKIVTYTEPVVEVTGTVNAWRCGVYDPYNNGSEVRYTVNTGIPAVVKFVRDENCCTFMGETDDSSTYILTPEVGDYFAVIETPHGRPDTVFDISLRRDTIIDFDIVYDYLTPDTVYVRYDYPNPADSLGFDTEWDYVYLVNLWSHEMLNLDGVQRTEEYLDFMDWIIITYSIPTKPGYAPWMVEDQVIRRINPLTVPAEFSFRLDWYFCLH